MTPAFAFIHTATVRKWTGFDLNAPTYASPVTIKCRVELEQKKVKRQGTSGGAVQEVIASGTVFMPAGTRMEPDSTITWDGRTFTVLSVEPIFGFVETHVEVTIL